MLDGYQKLNLCVQYRKEGDIEVLNRPEGESLSALESKRNVQVTFVFDDNLLNFKNVNHISNNDIEMSK